MIRPRRTGSLMQTAALASSPVQRGPGSRTPCSTTVVGVLPASHMSALNVGDVHEQHVVAVGERVPAWSRPDPAARCARGRRRGRRVRASGRSHRAASSASSGRCSTTTSTSASASSAGETSTAFGGQSHAAGLPAAPGPALGQRRQQVAVGALDERRRPGAVHVPDQDVHAGTSRRRARQRGHGVDDGLGGHRREAGMAGHRALAGAGVAAGGLLVAEQDVRHPVGRPAHGGDDRREQRHDRGADRRGQVRRAGVADDDRGGPRQHPGQLREVGAAAEVGARATGDRRR